jgi:hypothetical protein
MIFRQLFEPVSCTYSYLLACETLVYPGHDYEGRFVSSIAREKTHNPRLKDNLPLAAFVALMNGLDLPYPGKMDFAVPGNQDCGQCPPDVPAEFRAPCDVRDQG